MTAMDTEDKNKGNEDCRISEPVRLGEILPEVMRDIEARRKMQDQRRETSIEHQVSAISSATRLKIFRGISVMSNKEQLNNRQIAVLDDLFGGQLDEQAVLDKHKVTRRLYNKWQGCESFTAEYGRRMAALGRQSELIIARYASVAAANLVQLTDSENQETARKACLDIISLTPRLPAGDGLAVKKAQQPVQTESIGADSKMQPEPLPPQIAAKLLAALAEEKEE